jgi:hypothetical protein
MWLLAMIPTTGRDMGRNWHGFDGLQQ